MMTMKFGSLSRMIKLGLRIDDDEWLGLTLPDEASKMEESN